MKKEEYLKAIDDISFKIYLFKKYLGKYPYDTVGVAVKDRYDCMLKKLLEEYKGVYSEPKEYQQWNFENYEDIC